MLYPALPATHCRYPELQISRNGCTKYHIPWTGDHFPSRGNSRRLRQVLGQTSEEAMALVGRLFDIAGPCKVPRCLVSHNLTPLTGLCYRISYRCNSGSETKREHEKMPLNVIQHLNLQIVRNMRLKMLRTDCNRLRNCPRPSWYVA